MSGRRKIQVGVHLTPDQLQLLGALSTATRVPMSVYIREAIDLVIRLHEAPK